MTKEEKPQAPGMKTELAAHGDRADAAGGRREAAASGDGVVEDIAERKRAGEDLKESENKLSSLLSSIGDLIFMFDEKGRFTLYHAPAGEDLYVPPEHFIGKTHAEVMPSHLNHLFEKAFESNQRGEISEYEYSLEVGGAAKWYAAKLSPVFRNGEFRGSVGVIRDITERKRAEEALRESEAKARLILDVTTDIIVLSKPDGTLIDCNEAFASMLGKTREQIVGVVQDTLFSTDRAEWRRRVRDQVLATGRTVVVEDHSSDGSRVIQSTVYPVRDENNKVSAFAVYGRDITDLRRAQEALQQSERQYRGIFNATSDAMAIQDETGRFLDVNERLCAMTGYDRATAVTLSIDDLSLGQPPFSQAEAAEKMRQALEEGPQVFEWRSRRRNGELFWSEVALRADEIEGERRVIASVRDITERKRAEEALREMERRMQHVQKLESLGVLAGGIAHDFNNILMGVLGYADLALMELPAMSPARGSIGEIVKAARRASDLCHQMLAYSGRGKFVIETIDLDDLVSEMAHLLKTFISKKAILNLNLMKGLPPIEGDATQIRQILMNLITNASEAIGERSGVITISTGVMDCSREYLAQASLGETPREGRYVYLEVSDTGCGMDKETLDRIFEPFFTTKFIGRGLGMAAALGIVRGHKGAITVSSEVDGTTFRVLFPAVEEATERAGAKSGAAVEEWKGGGCVLLVDDEETVRAVGKKMLEKAGFQALTAADGQEAIRLYEEQRERISFVLLDLTMPRMDGEETFRELRRIDPKVRVIMSSGYSEQDIMARFAGRDLAGFIQKPFSIEELTAKARETLDKGEPPCVFGQSF